MIFPDLVFLLTLKFERRQLHLILLKIQAKSKRRQKIVKSQELTLLEVKQSVLVILYLYIKLKK